MELSTKKLEFDVNQDHLIGELWGQNVEQKSDFVFLHGAGKSTRKRTGQFFTQETLAEVPNILSFDQSGHGDSTGIHKQTSLEQRTAEAIEAVKLFTTQKALSVCGSSMGGYVALEMLKSSDIRNLILFAPAVYNKEAFSARFDQGFTDILRRPNSWEDNSVMEELQKFRGNLLVVIGENDVIIPKGVIEIIDQNSKSTRSKEIRYLPGCPHAIHDWLDTHEQEKKDINRKIVEFLNRD